MKQTVDENIMKDCCKRKKNRTLRLKGAEKMQKKKSVEM